MQTTVVQVIYPRCGEAKPDDPKERQYTTASVGDRELVHQLTSVHQSKQRQLGSGNFSRRVIGCLTAINRKTRN